MPTAPQPDPTPNGARNLFLDADPIDYDTLPEPDEHERHATPAGPRPGHRRRSSPIDRRGTVSPRPRRQVHPPRRRDRQAPHA